MQTFTYATYQNSEMDKDLVESHSNIRQVKHGGQDKTKRIKFTDRRRRRRRRNVWCMNALKELGSSSHCSSTFGHLQPTNPPSIKRHSQKTKHACPTPNTHIENNIKKHQTSKKKKLTRAQKLALMAEHEAETGEGVAKRVTLMD